MDDIELGDGTTLVLGGARSGKSVFAERLVAGAGLTPVYIATAQVFDAEMGARIARHRARRGARWRLVEAHDDLEGALAREAVPGSAVLVDCLTLWVTNLMLAEADLHARFLALLDALAALDSPVVLVSNEVGLGIVPDNAMARDFRDHAGRLNQEVAAQAAAVFFVAAGLPLKLKG